MHTPFQRQPRANSQPAHTPVNEVSSILVVPCCLVSAGLKSAFAPMEKFAHGKFSVDLLPRASTITVGLSRLPCRNNVFHHTMMLANALPKARGQSCSDQYSLGPFQYILYQQRCSGGHQVDCWPELYESLAGHVQCHPNNMNKPARCCAHP